MASYIKKGESILIPFRNGISITDSQLKPRMYKTVQAFEKSFPSHYLGNNGVELVEYAEVVRCKDCILYKPNYLPGLHKNDNCGICDRYPFLSEDHKFRTETDFCSYGERKDDEIKR